MGPGPLRRAGADLVVDPALPTGRVLACLRAHRLGPVQGDHVVHDQELRAGHRHVPRDHRPGPARAQQGEAAVAVVEVVPPLGLAALGDPPPPRDAERLPQLRPTGVLLAQRPVDEGEGVPRLLGGQPTEYRPVAGEHGGADEVPRGVVDVADVPLVVAHPLHAPQGLGVRLRRGGIEAEPRRVRLGQLRVRPAVAFGREGGAVPVGQQAVQLLDQFGARRDPPVALDHGAVVIGIGEVEELPRVVVAQRIGGGDRDEAVVRGGGEVGGIRCPHRHVVPVEGSPFLRVTRRPDVVGHRRQGPEFALEVGAPQEHSDDDGGDEDDGDANAHQVHGGGGAHGLDSSERARRASGQGAVVWRSLYGKEAGRGPAPGPGPGRRGGGGWTSQYTNASRAL